LSVVVLDSGVIAEYANVSGRFNAQARVIFDSLGKGELRAAVAPPSLSEVFYVLSRLYETVGEEEPEKKASKFCEYLYFHPNVEVCDMPLSLIVEAGRIKHVFGLALVDCYVLALSKLRLFKAVFRHREREMKKIGDKLGKEFEIVFLEDYE
jgi:predicted nucleic acid-binding protein